MRADSDKTELLVSQMRISPAHARSERICSAFGRAEVPRLFAEVYQTGLVSDAVPGPEVVQQGVPDCSRSCRTLSSLKASTEGSRHAGSAPQEIQTMGERLRRPEATALRCGRGRCRVGDRPVPNLIRYQLRCAQGRRLALGCRFASRRSQSGRRDRTSLRPRTSRGVSPDGTQ